MATKLLLVNIALLFLTQVYTWYIQAAGGADSAHHGHVFLASGLSSLGKPAHPDKLQRQSSASYQKLADFNTSSL